MPGIETRQKENHTAFKTDGQANEARIAELVALERIGRELNSTLDLDQILDLLIRKAVDLTPAVCGSVLLVSGQVETLQPRAWYGYTTPQVGTLESLSKLSQLGIVRQVLTTGKTAVVDDVLAEPGHVKGVSSTRSELAVPIRHGHEIVGVLDLESPEPGAFGYDSQRFSLAVAEQAAIAIGNARRYAEQVKRETSARQRSAQLRDLIAISHELHTEHVLDDVLDRIMQAIPETGGFNVAILSLVDSTSSRLRRAASAGIPLTVFEELRQVEQPLSTFVRVLEERYRISRSYFLPHQKAQEWQTRLGAYTALRDNGTRQEGEWHPGDLLIVPLRDSKGQLLGLLSVDDPQDRQVPTRESIEILELFANEAASAIENARLHDESELRVRQRTDELAQALRRQAIEADKTRAIVESISDAVCVFDPDGKVILVNRATARVLGLEPKALMGRSLSEQAFPELSEKDGRITAEMFQAARSARHSLANGDELVNTAFEAARRVIRASFSSVTLQKGEPLTVVAVFRDITEESELDRMKSEFISMAAHELRTPMTSITSYVDLLMLGMLGPVTQRQTEFLQVVKTNARRLMTLVSDLLDLERMESEGLALDLRPTSLSDVVAEVTLAMRRQIEAKGQVLTVDVPKDMPKAMVDRDRMIQVMTNLLSNAHKYSPRGAQIAVSGQHENGHLMIQVRDAGIGISATDQQRLFTRFFRTDDAVLTQESGTGLGLAICHEIMKRHHGEIQVESEEGKGSTFRLLLPFDASIEGKALEKDAR